MAATAIVRPGVLGWWWHPPSSPACTLGPDPPGAVPLAGEKRDPMRQPEPAITVFVADDSVIIREGVRAMLGREPDLEVVGVAEDYDTLVAGAEAAAPQVIVSDIRMPQIDGLQLFDRVRRLDADLTSIAALTTTTTGRDLLTSIVEKLLVLDDDTVVLPGHGPMSTIGLERRTNPFLEGLA